MDFENINIYSFSPGMAENETPQQQLIARNFTNTLASLANLANIPSSQIKPNKTLEFFKYDKTIDLSIVNIKEFSDNFKDIKQKLSNIEVVIVDLESKREELLSKYEKVTKILSEFFGFSENMDMFSIIKKTTFDMISKLELEKYYEERTNLLNHYKVAVPLLNQVKDEFFKNSSTISNCPICYEKNITYVMIPCGHTLCEDCKKKIISNCFVCRTPVSKINKIFIT
jgi:hypothetical protein